MQAKEWLKEPQPHCLSSALGNFLQLPVKVGLKQFPASSSFARGPESSPPCKCTAREPSPKPPTRRELRLALLPSQPPAPALCATDPRQGRPCRRSLQTLSSCRGQQPQAVPEQGTRSLNPGGSPPSQHPSEDQVRPNANGNKEGKETVPCRRGRVQEAVRCPRRERAPGWPPASRAAAPARPAPRGSELTALQQRGLAGTAAAAGATRGEGRSPPGLGTWDAPRSTPAAT